MAAKAQILYNANLAPKKPSQQLHNNTKSLLQLSPTDRQASMAASCPLSPNDVVKLHGVVGNGGVIKVLQRYYKQETVPVRQAVLHNNTSPVQRYPGIPEDLQGEERNQATDAIAEQARKRANEPQLHSKPKDSSKSDQKNHSKFTHGKKVSNSSVESVDGVLDPTIAEIHEVPEWITDYANKTPWEIHSEVYNKFMKSDEGIGIDGVAETWEGFLAQMGEMEFLGHTVIGHTAFLRQLDIAQRYLRGTYPTLKLSVSVGEPGSRSQWRAAERLTSSPHLFGMAIDINVDQNPWMGNPRQEKRNTSYGAIIWRATWLLGSGKPVSAQESHERAGARSPASTGKGKAQSTEEIWNYFNDANQATLKYLDLADNQSDVEEHLKSLQPPQSMPSGYLPDDITVERLKEGLPAIDDWMKIIKQDRLSWPNRDRGGDKDASNDKIRGFMNLKLELVKALRDGAKLQWGACDLGKSDSGDMMHFALDPARFMKFRREVGIRLKESKTQMSAQEYKDLERVEKARREKLAKGKNEQKIEKKQKKAEND